MKLRSYIKEVNFLHKARHQTIIAITILGIFSFAAFVFMFTKPIKAHGNALKRFTGNPYSYLYFDQGGERINLRICADSIRYERVEVTMYRPPVDGYPERVWHYHRWPGNNRCITFYDLDGAGPTFQGVPYSTFAAINGNPSDDWGIPCWAGTGGYGLCDRISR